MSYPISSVTSAPQSRCTITSSILPRPAASTSVLSREGTNTLLIHSRTHSAGKINASHVRSIECAHHIVGMDKKNVLMRVSYKLVSISTSNDKRTCEHLVKIWGRNFSRWANVVLAVGI